MVAGLKFTRIDHASAFGGLDIKINSEKIGWLRDQSSLEVILDEGDHLIEIGNYGYWSISRLLRLHKDITTSLVFALKDSLNGISTTTASTGVPGVSEYSAGR